MTVSTHARSRNFCQETFLFASSVPGHLLRVITPSTTTHLDGSLEASRPIPIPLILRILGKK